MNFIAVTSPAYEGAFRFEAAYRKGRAGGGWWTSKVDKLGPGEQAYRFFMGYVRFLGPGPKLAHTSLEVGVIATTYNSTYFGN